ncbi:MAG: [FeFe] hydrogenase, group A [Ignavibacteria bacterium]|nr:[FeFe] hydrogenase, group A [Ignavibacteria bacterium]
MTTKNIVNINGIEVPFNGERNLLEVIRKANIEIPTFCYHSELSVYGACRLCLIEVEGRGLVSSCSLKPEAGMKIKTHTKEIRDIRKISMELILANHDQNCTSCVKSSACKLQEVAQKIGVTSVRFKKAVKDAPLDLSSTALVRDPNKCILCGDCVRACSEIQGIGAIDFAYRGANVTVTPAFNKDLAHVECVDCGQCMRVCPTGSITIKSEIEKVWKALDNPQKYVVAQIAPAVRVAIGEMFAMKSGELATGQVVAALKMLGFKKVFDTSFSADLTVIEEANEFLHRAESGENLPLFTSCCPAWVTYAEQYYPEFLSNLSSCKSPQQMLGAIIKESLPEMAKTKRENVVVVSIMPCTAKKSEAVKDEKSVRDVDFVLTTQDLVRMIAQAGISFDNLLPDSFDMPFGFKSGAGILFGNSGGVTEAVLRYLSNEADFEQSRDGGFAEVRGTEGRKEITYVLNGKTYNLAVVQGLKNAKELLKDVKSGKKQYDFVEVMSCPGGCIGGAGQPVCFDESTRSQRARGIYEADRMMQIHKSQDNPSIKNLYDSLLGTPGSEKAHELLHTHYHNKKRIRQDEISLIFAHNANTIDVKVCVGTSCYIRGAQDLLHKLVRHIESKGLQDIVSVKATFCFERCDQGPTVTIGKEILHHCTFAKATEVLDKQVKELAMKN